MRLKAQPQKKQEEKIPLRQDLRYFQKDFPVHFFTFYSVLKLKDVMAFGLSFISLNRFSFFCQRPIESQFNNAPCTHSNHIFWCTHWIWLWNKLNLLTLSIFVFILDLTDLKLSIKIEVIWNEAVFWCFFLHFFLIIAQCETISHLSFRRSKHWNHVKLRWAMQ